MLVSEISSSNSYHFPILSFWRPSTKQVYSRGPDAGLEEDNDIPLYEQVQQYCRGNFDKYEKLICWI